MAGRDDYGQEQQDQQRFVVRILLALVLLAAVLLLIGWRLSGLQVGAHTHFTTLSENNRLRVEPIAPSRGVIRDRNGQLLAGNRASYQLEVTVEQAGNLDELLERLHDFVELSEADIERFRRGVRQRRPFQPVLLKSGLDDTTVARIAVSRHELPGVEIEARPMRFYPLGDKLSHVVGYVGRINEQDLARVDPRAYAGSSHIGKIGVERYYEDLLHGRPGYRQVEVNAQGRVIRELSVTPPEAGTDITLTIDADLQRAAYRSLAGREGAIVALDPNNGEVLALVSAPGFDPEMFVRGISQADFSDLPVRPLAAAVQPRPDRAVPAGLHDQAAGGPGGAGRGDHHRRSQDVRPGLFPDPRPRAALSRLAQGRPWLGGYVARHRGFLRRVFLRPCPYDGY